jgi:hypothetical protein
VALRSDQFGCNGIRHTVTRGCPGDNIARFRAPFFNYALPWCVLIVLFFSTHFTLSGLSLYLLAETRKARLHVPDNLVKLLA